MANGHILPPVTWAAVWWLLIPYFASTHFHSLCAVNHMYNSPLLGPSSAEISMTFITDLNGNGIRAQIAQSVCMADFKVIQQCSSGSGTIWCPQLPTTQIGNTGLNGLCRLTTTSTFSFRSGASSPAAGVSSTESFQKLSSCHMKSSADPGFAMSWKSALVLLLKNVRKIFSKRCEMPS